MRAVVVALMALSSKITDLTQGLELSQRTEIWLASTLKIPGLDCLLHDENSISEWLMAIDNKVVESLLVSS
ncbi:unnamed protein product [Urochloa humidicola]